MIDGLASTVRVDILEKLVPSLEDLLNVLVDLGVVTQAIVKDHGARNQSVMLKTDCLESQMLRITLKIVKLVDIQAVFLVCNDLVHPPYKFI